MAECLYKPPRARPRPANILDRLRASQRAPSPAGARLQAANQLIIGKQAHEGAKASAQQATEQQRIELTAVAQQSFEQILVMLIARIREAALAANVRRAQDLVVQPKDGVLAVDQVRSAPADCLARPPDPPPFDVIAYTAIVARKSRDRSGYVGRNHSLWFCDAHDIGVYRWFGTAFMISPFIRQRSTFNPFALPPTDEDAVDAFSSSMTIRQVAWEPLPFDQGDEEQFVEHWLGWLAAAADGTLTHPQQMPETSGGRHRRPGPR